MIPEFYTSWHIGWQAALLVLFVGAGFFLLIKGSDLFVDGAGSIAKKLHVSPLVIGLTVVAIGTSLPELLVSLLDSVDSLLSGGYANVSIGNVVGSNIANVLLVLGCSVLCAPIIITKTNRRKELPIFLFISVLVTVFTVFFGINGSIGSYAILRWEGIVLLVLFVAYMVFMVMDAKRHQQDVSPDEIKDMKTWKAVLFVVLGGICIAVGGEAVVFGAKGGAMLIATSAGWDRNLAESLVGLTVVAIGTSLPELVTSVVASKKGENELALGNVIGSNIFTVVFVLGMSATVNPLVTGNEIVVDVLVMLGVAVLLFGLSFTGKLGKGVGIAFVSLYVLYTAYLILRTMQIF